MIHALSYDKDTGLFHRNSKIAGCLSTKDGYWVIWYAGKLHAAHRIAWFFMTGKWPTEIDHINGNRSDNKWCNLREVTRSQNCMNGLIRQDNTSGFRGVCYCKQIKRWKARLGGKHIGCFDNKETAYQAYKKAAIEKYGTYVRL